MDDINLRSDGRLREPLFLLDLLPLPLFCLPRRLRERCLGAEPRAAGVALFVIDNISKVRCCKVQMYKIQRTSEHVRGRATVSGSVYCTVRFAARRCMRRSRAVGPLLRRRIGRVCSAGAGAGAGVISPFIMASSCTLV